MKKCNTCHIEKPLNEFHNLTRSKDGKNPMCIDCRKNYYTKNHTSIRKSVQDIRESSKGKKGTMLYASKCRAKRKNIEHSITVEDIEIPKYCPYLGIRLKYIGELGQDSISLDRVDISKGYVPDNVEVVSNLANSMKSNATKEQLIIFAKEILRRFT